MNKTPFSDNASGAVGLIAQLRLFCLYYGIVALLLVIAPTVSNSVIPAALGLAMLVTFYVAGLMVEFILCGDCDESYR